MRALPATRGHMGSTTYYMTKLTGRELATSVRPARESDKWATASLDERIQRELDWTRIKRELIPYLARHADRFWGSIIVLADKGHVDWEPVTEVVDKLPKAYQSAVEDMGFLTVEGGELIALDGQHRLVTARELITSDEDLGEYQYQVNEDEMSIILIEYESAEKTRRIFNKVNRYAKPTGRTDNILLSEDDGYAIVARRLLDESREAPLADRIDEDGQRHPIVQWKSTTLSKSMDHVTTLSAVYDTVETILKHEGIIGWDEKKNPIRPSDTELERGYKVAAHWWDELSDKVSVLKSAFSRTIDIRSVRFDDDDRRTLLLRPVGQIALVRGLVLARENARLNENELPLEVALERVNQINWSASSTNYFRDTIVRSNGRMSAREEAYNIAGMLIAYMIGAEHMDDSQRDGVWREWNRVRGRLVTKGNRPLSRSEIDTELDRLPEDEAEQRRPEPLPSPVEG